MTICNYVLLKIGQLTPKPVYNIVDPNDLKLLTRLRLGLSLQVESVSQFFCTVITSQI